jgi:predicted metal-binding membrane protein
VTARLRAVRTFHPEWWTLPVALAAWVALALSALGARGAPSLPSTFYCPLDAHTSGWSWTGYLIGMALWCAMSVAMMLPTNLGAIRYVGFSSLPGRRAGAIAMFALTFTTLWLPLGLLAGLWHAAGDSPGVVAVLALVAAAAWELTPWKAAALVACRRTRPIRLRGKAARDSCCRYGAHVGKQCVISCGPAMLALTLTGHPLLALIAVAPIVYLEKRRVSLAGPRNAMIAVLLTIAVLSATAPLA